MYRPLERRFRQEFDGEDEVLHASIHDGNVPRLRELLQPGHPSLSYIHPGFGTPLHYAAMIGDMDAIELLLAAGADVFLLDRGDSKATAIGLAARHGHREAVSRLRVAGTSEDELRTVHPSQSTLVVAAMYGRAAIVHDVLTSWDGWPQQLKEAALVWASRRWHCEVAHLLIQAADFDKTKLQEALCYAVGNKTELADEFFMRKEGFEYANQQSLITLLVDAGADPNYIWDGIPLLCTAGRDGMSLLLGAAENANLTGALRVLLEKGANPNACDMTGRSALHHIAGMVSQEQFDRPVINEAAIRLLIKYGGSVSLPDQGGVTPLHEAAYGLDLHLFQLYLSACRDDEQQALLYSKTHHQETLLHFSAAGGCAEIISFLVAKGLDVNAKNVNGWTPLMCALVQNNGGSLRSGGLPKTPDSAIQAGRCLLSFGADATVTSNEGWTALHCLALYCGYDFCGRSSAFAKQLLSHGANPNAEAVLLRPVAASYPSRSMPWGWGLGQAMADPASFQMVASPKMAVMSWAAERGALGVLRTLLDHGLDASSMDGGPLSPTRLAVGSPFLKDNLELT